ncbi:hypothetical protein BD833_103174 [Blastococcus xanthinilyticus]|uniref:Uncharacterized protein n=1 Tax=Blastococcus xanthinilyticus TaxID=1564164 RepID=A0A5S5D188_9ACTN|nr:hypothetical protein BD833_103174 [Blastococcus xanthinilyticus]
MATTTRLEQSPAYAARGRAASYPEPPVVVVRHHRRPATPRAAGSASMASLRWEFAFYGGFFFIPVGMAAASWLGP